MADLQVVAIVPLPKGCYEGMGTEVSNQDWARVIGVPHLCLAPSGSVMLGAALCTCWCLSAALSHSVCDYV